MGVRVGITMGEPAGIGPELVVRALAADGADGVTVFGDRRLLEDLAARMHAPAPPRIVQAGPPVAVAPGQPSAEGGAAQVAYLEEAVAAARRGELDALVTAPIHKASCMHAGFSFPGHTEFLAERLGAEEVAMMLAGPHLRVVPATIHCALAEVPARLAADGGAALGRTLALTARALRDDFGIARPRVAVCGLNPHAGEQGHFGDEEARVIAPAIVRARTRLESEGVAAELRGPEVPDAVFRAAASPPVGEGRWDAVVAMYHDQALIPVKLVDFDEAVNLTLGLPLVRTSPDHGVAWDVAAGRSPLRDGSFRAALRLARALGERRRSRRETGGGG
jgi:4-hydroxythreonine-4-phosphate dehydrogenase